MEKILSLCDCSGVWCQPYKDNSYDVIQVDLALGKDVRLLEFPGKVHGILAAPPCTEFSRAGARWRATKPAHLLLDALALVDACLRYVAICQPEWWALENPIGRLNRWLGEPSFRYDPWEYAGWADDPSSEAHTKNTLLWGKFNVPVRKPIEPVGYRKGQPNEWYSKVGGKSAKTKAYRSKTPQGFSRAFFDVNK